MVYHLISHIVDGSLACPVNPQGKAPGVGHNVLYPVDSRQTKSRLAPQQAKHEELQDLQCLHQQAMSQHNTHLCHVLRHQELL